MNLINVKKENFSLIKGQRLRRAVQFLFIILTLWIGWDFAHFVQELGAGRPPSIKRPPGVEAFLPISALMSLRYWIYTGILNGIHPASVVLLVTFALISLFLKKGFCGWICPFGLFSEYLYKAHQKLIRTAGKLLGKKLSRIAMPIWLDYPLRSLKYLILFYFVHHIFFVMSVTDLEYFIYSPYNRIADVKMLHFFTNVSHTTLWVLAILVGLSFTIPFFWCRYLCPYGALQGALSLLSPWKIRRNPETCTQCHKCSQACPAAIRVHTKKTVFSDECLACRQCLQACPEPDTLAFAMGLGKATKASPKSSPKKLQKDSNLPKDSIDIAKKLPRITPNPNSLFYGKLSKERYAALLLTIFVIAWLLAQARDNWQTQMSRSEYQSHIRAMGHPIYQHHRGQVAPYSPDKLKEYGFYFDKGVSRINENGQK